MNYKKYIINKILVAQFGGKLKWKTFSHNGVIFPPLYKPHNKPLLYNNKLINLIPEAEEYAMLYAKYIDTEYIKNKTFNKNFWNDWKKILGSNHEIKNLEGCNFENYKLIIQQNKENNDNKQNKELKEEYEKKFKIAYMDGKEQPVGNYRIEPPGLFIGRGNNPKIGKIKKRIMPEDIIINIGKESVVPIPPEGHKWKQIIHDQHVEWLISWKDIITGKTKYVWLGSNSSMKTDNDINKFDLARKLKKRMKLITEENNKNLINADRKIQQIATSLYFIDKLALRVGNEKSSDETDTVGITSLRVEHIKLLDDNKIELDFLGKDSVRYNNSIVVEPIIYNNLTKFIENKRKEDQLFELITPVDINKYLQTFLKGLTAKVFRTYNASLLLQKELFKINKKNITDKNLLLDEYNKANIKVALLCNHQKNVGKSFKPQIDKINDVIKNIKKKIKISTNPTKTKQLKDKLKQTKSKKNMKQQLKNLALGTSKANYIDPRITIAFMKKHSMNIEKVFSKTLQQKFKWAFKIDENFKF